MNPFQERVQGLIVIVYVFVFIGMFAVVLGFASW